MRVPTGEQHEDRTGLTCTAPVVVRPMEEARGIRAFGSRDKGCEGEYYL